MGGKAPAMRFMQQEGIPFFVWYIQFAGQVSTSSSGWAKGWG